MPIRSTIKTLLLGCLLASPALAQSTVVSITTVDSVGTVWADGTISYQFKVPGDRPNGPFTWDNAPLPQQYFTPTTVQLSDTGTGTWTIPSNTAITPAGSSWTYVICPNASTACTTFAIPATGASQDISSLVTPGLPAISISATNIPKAYQSSEVKTVPQQGGLYYDTTQETLMVWNGTMWVAVGGANYGPQADHIVCVAGPVTGPPALPTCRQLVQSDIAPDNAITSFNGGGPVEIGATVVNPSFTASYNFSPTGANITNTDNIDSPLVLSSPYTSGTVTGAFHKTVPAITTFTLTAIGAISTATANINWLPLTFAGSGAPAATTVTSSGGTAVLNGGRGTLPNIGLNNQCIGGGCSITTSGLQTIYLLLTVSGETFKDCNTGFAMPFDSTSVSFLNQNGATIAMTLYFTPDELEGNYAPCAQ